jgi:hypothetical protein
MLFRTMTEMQSFSFWLKSHLFYCGLGFIASLFYGIYATTVFFRMPDLRTPASGIDCEAWRKAWKDPICHPSHLHGCWHNFCGAATGWVALAYLLCRLERPCFSIGIVEAGLALTAAVGMTGYLPRAIAGVSASFQALADRLAK